MGELKRLLRYLGPYRNDLLIGALLVVVETCFELVIPVLMADLIDVGVANQDTTMCSIKERRWESVRCALW